MAVVGAWDESLGTGVDSMDAEHQLQASLIHTLGELLRHGSDASLASRTLAQLADFTSVHFLSEELMMRLHGFPQHGDHEAEHRQLATQVEEIQRRVQAGESTSALTVIDDLQRWLTSHIKSMDQAFARWCAQNRIAVR
jgi:hemerythrin